MSIKNEELKSIKNEELKTSLQLGDGVIVLPGEMVICHGIAFSYTGRFSVKAGAIEVEGEDGQRKWLDSDECQSSEGC